MMYVFLILVIYCFCFQYSMALPPGFREEGIVKINDVSTIGFVPLKDDFVFLAAVKNGVIKLILNPGSESSNDIKTETVLDLSDRICTNGEHGLHQVRAHPQIEENGYIYVSYTYNKQGECLVDTLKDGPVTRLSRFILDLDELKIDADSEEVLLETDPLRTKTHNGGDIVFGKDDGYLYFSIGDSGMKHPETPQQELNHLFGKIIRITDDGKIPLDNPWKNDDDNEDEDSRRCNFGGHNDNTDVICEEIFAFGFRNPFRMNQHPDSSTTRIYVSDVGGTTWEEINEIESGGNYGFPIREGPCKKKSYDECKIPSDRSLKDPTFWYPHDSEGAACVAGSAVVPKGIGWPEKYENAMMYLDFVFDKLYLLEEDIDGACRECDIPIPEYFNSTFFDLLEKDLGKPVQLLFGPYKDTQALYYTTRYGSPNIRRIWYDGGNNDEDDKFFNNDIDDDAKPHRQPIATATADKLLASIGTDIQFDGSESLDPDGGDLTYYWSFGDGNSEDDEDDDESSSTESNPSHAYNEPGVYTVNLLVTDPGGISDTVQILVSIGTPPPEPIIESPEVGATFAVGDVFILKGMTGDDNDDDGDLLEWEVRKHHKDHFHPFLDHTTGNNIRIDPGPSPEDFLASTNSYLEVLLTVTDSKTGLSTTTSRNIMPKMVQLVFDSEPESGMELVLDGYSVTTPSVVTSWVNHELHVEVPADQRDGFKFLVWSNNDGLGIESGTERTIVVREREDKFTALFMTLYNLENEVKSNENEIGNITEDDDNDDDEDKNDEIENNEVVNHDKETDEKMEHENEAIEIKNDEIHINIGKEDVYSRERNNVDEVGSDSEESITIMYNESSARIGMINSISAGIIIFTSVVILALELLE